MEIGESVAVSEPGSGGGEDPNAQELTAEITELSFLSSIRAARGGATISRPHWQTGMDAADDWDLATRLGISPMGLSRRAAVYLVKSAGTSWDVEVKVRVQSRNVSGDATLTGQLDGLQIQGSCPSSSGQHTVQARIVAPPERIEYARGNITWSLQVSGGPSAALNSTPAEIFFILGAPISAYHSGVWIEALRLVCTRCGAAGQGPGDEAQIAAGITRYCHTPHSLKYDTFGGRPFYGPGPLGGSFRLGAYLRLSSPIGNCYDQAGAVQSLCGALGVSVNWVYLNPYGFIQTTDLVGWGQCNSPFFREVQSLRLLPRDDPRRTSFGNHAFCEIAGSGAGGSGGGGTSIGGGAAAGAAIGAVAGAAIGAAAGAAASHGGGGSGKAIAEGAAIGALAGAAAGAATGAGVAAATGAGSSGKILDACAGPHLATESREQYTASAIDYATERNRTRAPPWPGTASLMVGGQGVQSVD